MTRPEILDKAKECVCGQREQDYGSPEDNFGTIAALWTAYLHTPVSSVDVPMMMAMLKIARVGSGTGTDDSFVDLAGYAACGGEIAAKNREKTAKAYDPVTNPFGAYDPVTNPFGAVEKCMKQIYDAIYKAD